MTSSVILVVVILLNISLALQLDMGMDAFMRNSLEIDWDILAQGDTCIYDTTPSCSDEFPTNV